MLEKRRIWLRRMGDKEKCSRFVGFEKRKWSFFLALILGMKKECVKKKEEGQIFPFYNTRPENSLTVRLELRAVNDHNCPMTSTTEMKGLFKVSNQR